MTNSKLMYPEIRDMWAEAWSDEGAYPSGKGFLCREYEGRSLFDPLGVLCEVGVAEGIIQAGTWKGDEELVRYKMYHGEQGILPKEIVEWAGLSSRNPSVMLTPKERRTLGLPHPRYRTSHGVTDAMRVALVSVHDHGRASRYQMTELINRL